MSVLFGGFNSVSGFMQHVRLICKRCRCLSTLPLQNILIGALVARNIKIYKHHMRVVLAEFVISASRIIKVVCGASRFLYFC